MTVPRPETRSFPGVLTITLATNRVPLNGWVSVRHVVYRKLQTVCRLPFSDGTGPCPDHAAKLARGRSSVNNGRRISGAVGPAVPVTSGEGAAWGSGPAAVLGAPNPSHGRLGKGLKFRCVFIVGRDPARIPGQIPLSRPVPRPRRAPAVSPGSSPEPAVGEGGGIRDAGGDGWVNP